MFNYYMPPYKAAVDAGAMSVMTSFNTFEGIPSTANRWLLTDVLRGMWGFKGMVVTDYTAIAEMMDHGLGDLKTVSALALNAGTDMDMMSDGYRGTLAQSISEGKVSEAAVNAACRRVSVLLFFCSSVLLFFYSCFISCVPAQQNFGLKAECFLQALCGLS